MNFRFLMTFLSACRFCMSDPICFVSSVFCSGVKETVEDNCVLAHNILEMLETRISDSKLKSIFGSMP